MQMALVIEKVYCLAPDGGIYPFTPSDLYTHFPIKLTPDAFRTGPDDYDVPSNEIYCPCGRNLPWPSGTVGDAMRLVAAEMKEHGK